MLLLDEKSYLDGIVGQSSEPKRDDVSEYIGIKDVLKGILVATVPGTCMALMYLENKMDSKDLGYNLGHYSFLYGMSGAVDGLKGWMWTQHAEIYNSIVEYVKYLIS